MHDRQTSVASLGAKSVFAAVALASALALACSTASAQGSEPVAKNQISIMLGSGQFETDLGLFGTEDDVQPISLSYGFNFTERHGILIQRTPSTDLEEAPGFEASYDSTYILYKATFPTIKENIESYWLVGLSTLAWGYTLNTGFGTFSRDESGAGLAAGVGLDLFVSPEVSLRLLYLIDFPRDAGDTDVSTSILNFGVGFHF